MDQPDDGRQLGRMVAIAQIGLEMVAPIILGMVLDNWLETTPWLTMLGAVVGLVGGIYHLLLLRNRPDDPPRGPSS